MPARGRHRQGCLEVHAKAGFTHHELDAYPLFRSYITSLKTEIIRQSAVDKIQDTSCRPLAQVASPGRAFLQSFMTFYVPEHQLHLASESGREKYRHRAFHKILSSLGWASKLTDGLASGRTGLRKFIEQRRRYQDDPKHPVLCKEIFIQCTVQFAEPFSAEDATLFQCMPACRAHLAEDTTISDNSAPPTRPSVQPCPHTQADAS